MGPRVVVTFEDSHSQISTLSVFFYGPGHQHILAIVLV